MVIGSCTLSTDELFYTSRLRGNASSGAMSGPGNVTVVKSSKYTSCDG